METEDGWVPLGAVGTQLANLASDFDPRTYGFRKLSDLVRKTGAFELERPESLVTTGPYALSRHPMYVGWWLIHLGAGLLRGSGWVAVTLPVAVAAEHFGAGLVEERALRAAFGDEYERYAARVPRYVGLNRAEGRRSVRSARARVASNR